MRPTYPTLTDDARWLDTAWLVLFVAAYEGKGALTIIGWYEDATFEERYRERPDYSDSTFERDSEQKNYLFCVTSSTAVCLPREERTRTVSGDHFRRTPIVYVRDWRKDEEVWRRDLAALADEHIQTYETARRDQEAHLPPYLPPELRKCIEEAAVKITWRHLEANGYEVEDVQRDHCGFDLLARRTSDRSELHVEVKGTSKINERFWITPGEREYMLKDSRWRLALVTEALDRPNLVFFDQHQAELTFSIETAVFMAKRLR